MSVPPYLPSGRRRRVAFVRPWGPVRWLAVFLVGSMLSVGAGTFAYFWPLMATLFFETGQAAAAAPVATARAHPTPTSTASPVALPPAPAGAFTVLLLGSDDDSKFESDHVLTQSMILVRVIPSTHQVTMFSIPRDLWVPLSTGGSAKIDAAYSYGGAGAAIATVEEDFHVHVDHYVWIGLQGLVNLINTVGGINLDATHPVLDDYYPADLSQGNAYSYLRVAVLPGPQHLNGVAALQYVRSRHGDLAGDFARSQRQQQVLIALKSEAKLLNPADLPALVSDFSGEMKTDFNITQIGQMLALASAFDHLSTIHQYVLLPPYTRGSVIDHEDVLLPNWSLILPLVQKAMA